MNKVTVFAAAALALANIWADGAYELVNDKNGYSYIQINENVDSFTFTSDFKSIGNSGKVGFFIYPNGLEGQALKDYIASVKTDDAQFGKKIDGGKVDLGALSAGDRVGFYLERNNGDIARDWSFVSKGGTTYISFEKNGNGKDEWMSVGDISAIGSGNKGEAPMGQPLPGALAVLALGGIGAGIAKLRSGKKTA